MLDQIGSCWIKLDHDGSNCIMLDQIVSCWIKLDHAGSNWIKPDHAGSNWIMMDQTGLDWYGHGWRKMEQTRDDNGITGFFVLPWLCSRV